MKELSNAFVRLLRSEDGFFNVKYIIYAFVIFMILYSLRGILFSGFGEYFFGVGE